jgi:hypothetical protein
MRHIQLAIILLLALPLVFSHGADHEGDESDKNTFLPFYYLEENDYLGALFITAVWFFLIKGTWELTKLIIGRAL